MANEQVVRIENLSDRTLSSNKLADVPAFTNYEPNEPVAIPEWPGYFTFALSGDGLADAELKLYVDNGALMITYDDENTAVVLPKLDTLITEDVILYFVRRPVTASSSSVWVIGDFDTGTDK